MCSLLKSGWIVLIGTVIFIGCLIGSAKTILNSKDNRKYVIYRDKLTVQSSTLFAEIPLKNVFMVKPRKHILEYLLKRDAHMVMVRAKDVKNQYYILPFIDEDVNALTDELMELAISARIIDTPKQTKQHEKPSKQNKNKTKTAKQQTFLEQIEDILTEDNSKNLIIKTVDEKKNKNEIENKKVKSTPKNKK